MQIPQRDKWRMYETIPNMSVCLPLLVLFVGIMERLRGGRAGIDKEALFHTNLIPLCQYTDNASNGVCKRVKVNISEPWCFKSQGAFGNKTNAGSASPSAEAEISGRGSWLCPLAEVAREETQ